jgi:hypothetical protein
MDDMPSVTDAREFVCGTGDGLDQLSHERIERYGAAAPAEISQCNFSDLLDFSDAFERALARVVTAREEGRTEIPGEMYTHIYWTAAKAMGLTEATGADAWW